MSYCDFLAGYRCGYTDGLLGRSYDPVGAYRRERLELEPLYQPEPMPMYEPLPQPKLELDFDPRFDVEQRFSSLPPLDDPFSRRW